MKFPDDFLPSLQNVKGFDAEAFEAVHASGQQVTAVRINPAKPASGFAGLRGPFTGVPWSAFGYYLPSRPSFTFDPLFHAGCYYVQDASSMFLELALKQLADLSAPLKVLDLCAAPGGKSTHIQSLISAESLLVSNEVIRGRGHVLKDNIVKWGTENVMVTHNDPAHFTKFENYFDVIVVDAPCSGSGLFRKDPDAIREWSQGNVQLCSQRQQRILADAWPALRPGGVLVYATCSYSREEDEEIGNWILQNLSAQYCPLTIDKAWGIVESETGYRFWPYRLEGEGFFLACFRKTGSGESHRTGRKNKPEPAGKKEKEIIQRWVKAERMFITNGDTVYAWPGALVDDFGFLLDQLRVSYSGTHVGQLIREKLVPSHALAMSPFVADDIPRASLDPEQSIRYLQRKDLETGIAGKGWQLAAYQGHALGWINVLQNRINNYYPRELRIMKDI